MSEIALALLGIGATGVVAGAAGWLLKHPIASLVVTVFAIVLTAVGIALLAGVRVEVGDETPSVRLDQTPTFQPITATAQSGDGIATGLPGIGLSCDFNGYLRQAECTLIRADGSKEYFTIEPGEHRPLGDGLPVINLYLLSFASKDFSTSGTVLIGP